MSCPGQLKRPTSQLEAVLDDGFHGRAVLVGSMAFLNVGTEPRGGGTVDKKGGGGGAVKKDHSAYNLQTSLYWS